LIVGEPGAGKTGVIYNVAKVLEVSGNPLLMLAVDDAGSINLQSEIGLEHPIRDVLEHWPGTEPAYLLIDGLDAARGGPAEAIYKRLITEILELPDQRWRVIASVRTFDLKAGEQLKPLFKGSPPDPDHREEGPDLDQVRHILVKRWTEPEFELLLKSAPNLRAAIETGGSKLQELVLVPFNTQLLAEVVAIGVDAAELGSIRNQRQLLDLYWKHRVLVGGTPSAACLTSVVTTRGGAPLRLTSAQYGRNTFLSWTPSCAAAFSLHGPMNGFLPFGTTFYSTTLQAACISIPSMGISCAISSCGIEEWG
jgi:hypothetical protein